MHFRFKIGMSRYNLIDFERRLIERLLPNGTSIRADQPAATLRRGRDHCLGRSRVSLTTKIHAVVDAQGFPVRLCLTANSTTDPPRSACSIFSPHALWPTRHMMPMASAF